MKKILSVQIIKDLEKVPSEKFKNVEHYSNKKDQVTFKDIDPESPFFFRIKPFTESQSDFKNKCKIIQKPDTLGAVMIEEYQVEDKVVVNQLLKWLSMVDLYNTSNTIFDDPHVERIKEEYFSHFEFVNDEGDKPYSVNEIPKVYQLLDDVKILIEGNIEDSEQSEQLLLEVKSIQDDLTTASRSKIVERFSHVWAKLSLLKTMFVKEFSTQAVKLVVKNSIEWISNNIDVIS